MLLANIGEQNNNFSSGFKLELVTIYHIWFCYKNIAKNVVDVTLLIKFIWSYNSLYLCKKCSMRFKNIIVGNLQNIAVMNEWRNIKKRIIKK